MANRDVTLIQNGEQVFPRTWTRNIYDMNDGKQVTLTDVLAEIKGVSAKNASDIAINAGAIAQLRTDLTANSEADAALALRVKDAEDRLDAIDGEEGELARIEGKLDQHINGVSGYEGRIAANEQAIATINGVIPTAASTTNQLADKDFVNSSINNVSAYYITKDADGNPFATKAELDAATVVYSGGEVRVPTRNDYVVVLDDETQPKDVDGTYPTTRYIYNVAEGATTGQWEFQYVVNNTALTADQLKAINSGITTELVAKITANETTIGTLSGTVESNKQAVDGEINIIKETAATLAKTVSDNKTEVDGEISGIKGRLDTAEGEIDKLQEDVTKILTEDFASLTERLDAIDGEDGSIATINGEITGIKGRLDAVDGETGRLAVLEEAKEDHEGRISDLETSVEGLVGESGSIAGITSRLDAIDGENGSIAGINSRLDAIDGEEGAIAGINETLESLQTQIDSKQANLTAGDYVSIEALEDGSQKISVVVDSALSDTSSNPVSNSVVKLELDKKVECSDEVEVEFDIEAGQYESRVASLEAQVAQLLLEVEALKKITPEA